MARQALNYPAELTEVVEGLADMVQLRRGVHIYAPATAETLNAAIYGPLYELERIDLMTEKLKNDFEKARESQIGKPATSSLMKPVTVAQTPACEKCGSHALGQIGRGVTRCNECGYAWAPKDLTELPSRKDLFK